MTEIPDNGPVWEGHRHAQAMRSTADDFPRDEVIRRAYDMADNSLDVLHAIIQSPADNLTGVHFMNSNPVHRLAAEIFKHDADLYRAAYLIVRAAEQGEELPESFEHPLPDNGALPELLRTDEVAILIKSEAQSVHYQPVFVGSWLVRKLRQLKLRVALGGEAR